MSVTVNVVIIMGFIHSRHAFAWTTVKSRLGIPPAPFKCRNSCHNLWLNNYNVLTNSRSRKIQVNCVSCHDFYLDCIPFKDLLKHRWKCITKKPRSPNRSAHFSYG